LWGHLETHFVPPVPRTLPRISDKGP
jgi:hypothetical protein